MQSKLLAIVALSTAVFAAPELRRRQATDPAQFSSAVSQLVDIYIPSEAAGPIESAIQSAASESGITGDITSIINSGLAEPSPPNYLTAVPTAYQDNFASLESAIDELRGAASTGIPGAPIVATDGSGNSVTSTLNAVTTTDSTGATIVGVTGPVTDSAAATPASSLTSGAVTTTDSTGATVVGLVAVTTDSAGSTLTSLTSTLPLLSSSTDTASSAASTTTATASTTTTRTSTTSSASAASPTTSGAGVPAALAPGAAGVVGLVGLLLAL